MKRYLWAYFFTLVFVSHVVLSQMGQKDFLFFSTWQMFSGGPKNYVYDLSWDEGKSFLFRDLASKMQDGRVNRNAIFSLLQLHSVTPLRDLFGLRLKEICHCEKIEIYKIQASPYEFFVEKKQVLFKKENCYEF